MVSLESLIQILFWTVPLVLPRALSLYRALTSPAPAQRQPLPYLTRLTLALTTLSIIAYLALLTPPLTPPNIFTLTRSRLALPVNLLTSRLHTARHGALTPLDHALTNAFKSDPSPRPRLLYAAYGPSPIAHCPFCTSDSTRSYFFYAIPALLTPHLLHTALLGALTSPHLTGAAGRSLRAPAAVATAALCAADAVLAAAYDVDANATRRSLRDVDWFFWRARMWRLLAFAAVDAAFAIAVWGRAVGRWPGGEEPGGGLRELQALGYGLRDLYQRSAAVGPVRRVVVADRELRARSAAYWDQEPRVMEEVEREREVVDAKNRVLGTMDVERVRHNAEEYVERVLGDLRPSVEKSKDV
ncbi:hypothetical protein EJ06DRAFT_75475 [Trichodelitschia bisporula]|uniref:Uncharacterized protein n=1 Tax=Trichodelitschia bisporula TaxID=703511 RepID=A0A6G1HTM9_9PEZI|nr:hypothetical protein EJ06DRAFT_75475 [Trichodelitschia bisporula]